MNPHRRSHDNGFSSTKRKSRAQYGKGYDSSTTVKQFIQGRISTFDLYKNRDLDFDNYLNQSQSNLQYVDYDMPLTMNRVYDEINFDVNKSKIVNGMRALLHDSYVINNKESDQLKALASLDLYINVNMLALCYLEGYDVKDSWYVVVQETYSGMEHTPGSRYITIPDTEIKLYIRPMNDFDRMGKQVGKSIYFDDLRLTALLDVCCPHDSDEYIIIGKKEEFEITINGHDYISYQHTDTPNSKTHIEHYRIGRVSCKMAIYGFKVSCPSLAYKMIKHVLSRSNFDENSGDQLPLVLPRPLDLYRVSFCISEEEYKLLCGLVWVITHNFKDYVDSFDNVIEQIKKLNISIKDIIVGEDITSLYKSTKFVVSEMNDNLKWMRSYSEIFDI